VYAAGERQLTNVRRSIVSEADQQRDTDHKRGADLALEAMRRQLAADGYGLRAESAGDALRVEVIALDGPCEDCLVSKDLFELMVRDELKRADLEPSRIQVVYPTDA
jgi:hypothetical protein